MSEDQKKLDEMSPVYETPNSLNTVHPTDEYKVGHHKPPLFLVVLYIGVLIWCSISWIPFYGY
jgi:hypothetical protein